MYLCPIGQLGDIFCSCTSYQMLGFQSLLLSLLSCVCCFFCWRVNDNGSILIPQQVDHSNIFHMSHDWICPSQSGGPILLPQRRELQVWELDLSLSSDLGGCFFPSPLSLNHTVHLISCWMFLLNSCNHTWRLVEVYVLSFLWQQPGGVRNVTFIPSCYMSHSLKVRKYSGLLTPASLGSTFFLPCFPWLVSLTT